MKNKKFIKLIITFAIIIAIPATVLLVRKITNLRPDAQFVVPRINLQPQSGDIVNGTTIRIFYNYLQTKPAFIRIVLNFDKTKLQLASEITVTTTVNDVIKKSTMAEANTSGQIVLALAAPKTAVLPSTSTFEIANFRLNKLSTTANDQTVITMDDVQIVNESANIVDTLTTNTSYTLNMPTVTATYTPTPTSGIQPNCLSALAVNDTSNAADWSSQSNLHAGDATFVDGSIQYGDRTYYINSLPSTLTGSDYIRTAFDSSSYTGATLATFNLLSPATVYVAHDDRITTKPSWMSGWTDSGLNIANNGNFTYSLYSKAFSAGTVSLGSNGSTTNNMYTVIVKCSVTATPTFTPTATPTRIITPTVTPTFTPTPTSTPTPTPTMVILPTVKFDWETSLDGWSRASTNVTGYNISTNYAKNGSSSLSLNLTVNSTTPEALAAKTYATAENWTALGTKLTVYMYLPSLISPTGTLTGNLYIENSSGVRSSGPVVTLTAGTWTAITWIGAPVSDIKKIGVRVFRNNQDYTGRIFVDYLTVGN